MKRPSLSIFVFCLVVAWPVTWLACAQDQEAETSTERLQLLSNAERILFLGDSITYAGDYVAAFDTWLAVSSMEGNISQAPVVINMGLPSETVSGLSEEGHAGGRFPRPDLHERLDRVLQTCQPNLVFACYGINCGIYQDFDQDRFRAYQEGIKELKEKVEAIDATLILITPPSFDDQRAKKPFSYNAVLDQYSNWLTEQDTKEWMVIDLHSAMTAELLRRRKDNPEFTFQPDSVHPNSDGHWFMASTLIDWFGDTDSAASGSPKEMIGNAKLPNEMLELIQQRMVVRRDAYLFAAGHLRPGIRSGLSIEEAEVRAGELTKKLRELLDR